MHLVPKLEGGPIHLSHFHHLVSAYATDAKSVERLALDLRTAVDVSRTTRESVIVEQDNLDHFFVVHPSGTVDLCCRMRSYTVGADESEKTE